MSFNRNVNITVTSNTQGLQAGMNQAVSTVNKATNSMKIFGGATGSLANGPLQNFQGSLQTLPKQMDQVGNAATKSGSKLKSLGEFVGGNKGLIFGFAGLSSAMAESIGMLGMYGDTAKMVQEDQTRLNKLIAEGAQGTSEFTQAQQEYNKHQRFFNMVQRNTMLSLMDNIFFGTMAANGMLQLGQSFSKAGSVISKIKGIFTGATSAAKSYSTIITGANGLIAGTSALDLVMGRTTKTVDGTTKAIGGLRAAVFTALGPIMALVAAIGLAIAGIASVEQMRKDAMNNNPEQFHKDSSGKTDESWFGPNSLFGRTLRGEPLPGEKTPLKGEQKSFESSPMGKLLNSIPGYKELGKTIGDLAGTQYPNMTASADETFVAVGNLATVQATWDNNIKKQLPNLKSIWQFYGPQIQKGISSTDMMIDRTQEWTKSLVENGQMTEQEATALNYMVAKRAEAYEKSMKNEEAANDAAKVALEEKMKLEDENMKNRLKGMVAHQELINKLAAEREEVRMNASEFVGYNMAHQMSMEQLARYVPIISNVTKGIHDQAEFIKDSAVAWTFYTDEQFQADIAQQQFIYSSIQLDKILVKSKENTLLYNKARIDAKMAIQDFVTQTELGIVAEKEQEMQLTKLITQYGIKLPSALDLSVEQLKAVWVAFRDGKKEAIVLADLLGQTLAPAFAKVTEAARTLAEGGKDAKKNSNKQLKDMHVPKFLDDDVKKQRDKLAQDMKKIMDVYDTFNAMAALNWEDKLGTKDLGKGIDFVLEKLSKMNDPELVDFGKWLTPGFEKLKTMSEEQRQTVMTKLIPVWDKLFGEKGILNDGEVTTSDLAAAQQLVREAFDLSVDPINQTGEAAKVYTEEMAKVEITGIAVQTIAQMWADLGASIINTNTILQENWSETVVNVAKMFGGLIVEIAKAWAGLAKGLNKMNVAIANSWERAMKNVLQNAKAAVSQSQSQFASLVKKLNSHFVKIANNWEKAMRNVVHNAKAAASQVNSALDKIKDKTVTITYVKKGDGGSISGKADGGIISAAHGFTTSGPQLLLVGDNPGGRETIAAIPHDSPRQTMDDLNRKFGTGENGRGSQYINFSPTIVIGQDKLTFTQRYRIQQGESVANQV